MGLRCGQHRNELTRSLRQWHKAVPLGQPDQFGRRQGEFVEPDFLPMHLGQLPPTVHNMSGLLIDPSGKMIFKLKQLLLFITHV